VRRVNNTAAQTSSLAVYRKVAGSSEPSAFSWDVSGAAHAAGEGQSIEGNYVLGDGATGTKTATAAGGADPGATHILALRPATVTLDISRPAGTAAKDVLIAAIPVRPASTTITAPACRTLVRRVDSTVGQTGACACGVPRVAKAEASRPAATRTAQPAARAPATTLPRSTRRGAKELRYSAGVMPV
jgi:hypothetical protein